MVWAVTLSTVKLSPHRLTPGVKIDSIWSLVRFGRLVSPLAYSVTLPLLIHCPRLVLELFRGEPAITRFD